MAWFGAVSYTHLDVYKRQELAHGNRADTEYQDDLGLLENLPVVLRGVCDYVLSGEAEVLDVAYALASLVDAIEHRTSSLPPRGQWH